EVPPGTKRTTGFVINLHDAAPAADKLKPIHAVLDDDEPALLPEIIDLCRWAAEYYIAPLGEMLRVALPANMAARGKREIVLVEDVILSREDGEGPPSQERGGAFASLRADDAALIAGLKKRPLFVFAALETF